MIPYTISMKIYRAMCYKELLRTVHNKEPDFIRRFKWFSPDIDWVKNRVMDNKFNNSKYVPGRYYYLCEFDWDNTKEAVYNKEIKLDRRDNTKIKFIKIIEENNDDK